MDWDLSPIKDAIVSCFLVVVIGPLVAYGVLRVLILATHRHHRSRLK